MKIKNQALMKKIKQDWDSKTLGEIADFQQGLQISKSKRLTSPTNNTFPLLKITDMISGHFPEHIKLDDIPKSVIAYKNDLILTRTGQIGLVFTDLIGVVHNNCFKVIVDYKKFDKYFIYYYLKSPYVQSFIKATASGSAQPDLTHKAFKYCPILVPPFIIQKKIGYVLSAYDNLIENNTRRIKILEEMAQMLYHEWFVNFRFPNHENVKMVESELGSIPEGWIGKLEDALILQRGFDLPHRDRKEGNIPIYAATGIVGTHSEVKVKAPCVITGRSGSLGTVLYIDEDFWALNTTLWTKEFRKVTPIYAFYLLSSLGLEQYNSGAAVPTLNRNDIHGLTVLIPSSEILKKFDEYILPLFKLKKSLITRNTNLCKTRDLLLPKLVSGEIDVENLDIETLEIAA
jgi:type I restriction enzyme S subunit